MTSKSSIVALGAMALIVLAGPALAQSIDLSPVQTLLQGIVDAILAPLDNVRMAELNAKVSAEGEEPADVAREYLISEGIIAG